MSILLHNQLDARLHRRPLAVRNGWKNGVEATLYEVATNFLYTLRYFADLAAPEPSFEYFVMVGNRPQQVGFADYQQLLRAVR